MQYKILMALQDFLKIILFFSLTLLNLTKHLYLIVTKVAKYQKMLAVVHVNMR